MSVVDEAIYLLEGDVKCLEDLKGRCFTRVEASDDEIKFFLSDTRYVRMCHYQDCCENVQVEDICGDMDDLVDAYIVHFEERSEQGDSEWGSQTWTYYDIQTTRGCVNIRWLGESNGYYSESVTVELVSEGEDDVTLNSNW